MTIDLVGVYEIGHRTGADSRVVDRWTATPSFPEPAAHLDVGEVWVWGPVHSWLNRHGYDTNRDLDLYDTSYFH